jgi:ribonuclease HI
MPSLTDITVMATEGGDFITPLVELRITTEVKTAKGRGGVTYGTRSAQLSFGDSRTEFSTTDDHKTIHNRGALLAAVAGLSALKRRCAVELHTDSEYLLQGATTWFPLRMALGWKTGPKAGRIRNYDLWGQLRDVAGRHDVHWIGPRKQASDSDVMPHISTELWRRTIGDGPDTGYLYCGNVAPWNDTLGTYRSFTDDEMGNPTICSRIDCTDDNTVTTLTAKEKQARKRVIARIAKHYRPEHIRPTPRAPIPVPTSSTAPIRLEPTQVHHLFAGYDEVTLLKYPRADRRFKHQTERTAVLEIGIEQ